METWIDCEETWIVLQGVAFAPIDCNHEFMLGLTTRNLYVALATAQSRNDTLLAEVWQQLLAREECRRLAPNFVRSSEATTSASPTAG